MVALATAFQVSLFPPSLESRSTEYAAASTQVLIDAGRSSPLVDLEGALDPLTTRAVLYTRLVSSDPVKARIAREAGVDPRLFMVTSSTPSGRFGAAAQASSGALPGAVPGANVIAFAAEEDLPVISIVAQSDTPAHAVLLADAAARGLIDYVRALEDRQAIPLVRRVDLRQLGDAKGGIVIERPSIAKAAGVSFGLFAVWCTFLLFGVGLVRSLRAPAPAPCRACGGAIGRGGSYCPECGTPVDRRPALGEVAQAPEGAAA